MDTSFPIQPKLAFPVYEPIAKAKPTLAVEAKKPKKNTENSTPEQRKTNKTTHPKQRKTKENQAPDSKKQRKPSTRHRKTQKTKH